MTRENDRVPHIIRGNKSGAVPQTWVVIDTETTPVQLEPHKWQHVFRLAVIAIWRKERVSKKPTVEYRRYTSADDLVRDLATLPKNRERVGIVAHNLDYDAQVLDIHCKLRALDFKLTKAIIERGKWLQRWQCGSRTSGRGARTLLWIDLMNFYPMALREVASWLGMKKWKLPDFNADDETWFTYCENDVRIELAALRAWLEFCESNDLGYFAPTIAGQAFNAYRHRFMSHPIYVHTHPDVIGMERAAYIGGRCQEFWRGNAPRHDYVHLDCNSMYGSVMLENRFPVKQVAHHGPVSLSYLKRILQTQAAIALVDIETDVPAFPLRVGARVVFPLGRFQTVLASPELSLAIEYGYLRDVLEVVTYDQAPIFREYVGHFWRLRQRARKRGDDYTSRIGKRFLAALHGKFGQRIFTSELILEGADREDEIWTEYDIEDGIWNEYRSLAGRVERRVREINGRDTLVAIPAHVASYARVKLWRWMIDAGLENVLYVDTDSLIVRREALKRIGQYVKPHTLGGLRIINQSRMLYIRAPKWYRFGRETKRAGVSFHAREVEWDQFEQDNFHSLRWSLSHQYSCAAIVEEVQINAPYRKLLTQHGIGHSVPPTFASEYT